MIGRNDNPTSEQLSGIVRQIITFQELTASEFSNCQDNLNILNVSSTWNPMITDLNNEPVNIINNEQHSIGNIRLNDSAL